MTVAFHTLGCKVNQVDSEALRQRLSTAGYACVEPEAHPDVVVLASCAVTAESERKTRQKLRHLRKILPNSILVLTGCAVQVDPEAELHYSEADILLGQRNSADLTHCIDEFLVSRDKVFCVSAHHRNELFDSAFPRETPANRTRANIKIEDGCDRFCSYCIIPRARGPVRSKPLAVLRDEMQILSQQGFQEFVLVGINLCAYGRDQGYSLCDAVAIAEEFTIVKRVRLGSLEPDLLTDEMLLSLLRVKSLCPHFHVSLQSGCDRTLKRMNRQYSASQYFNLINRIRSLFPHAAITTDLMVGFPGESDEDFRASLAFAREIEFAKIHVFPYSARPGTAAASFPDQIAKSEKLARAKETLSLAESLRHKFLSQQTGKTAEILLEDPHPAGGMQGYTAHYVPVRLLEAGPELRNTLVAARITGLQGDHCIGVLVE